MPITLKVTRERYEEVVSIDDDMHFFEMTNKQAYDYMLKFCVKENGEYMTVDEARKEFKRIPRKESGAHVSAFIKAIGEAFVNPPSGADSEEPSSQA